MVLGHLSEGFQRYLDNVAHAAMTENAESAGSQSECARLLDCTFAGVEITADESSCVSYGRHIIKDEVPSLGMEKMLRSSSLSLPGFLQNLVNLGMLMFGERVDTRLWVDKEDASSFTLHCTSSHPLMYLWIEGVTKEAARMYFSIPEVNVELISQEDGSEGRHSVLRVSAPAAYHMCTAYLSRRDEQVAKAAASKYTLEAPDFYNLLPFHLVIDEECRVIQAGSGMERLQPNAGWQDGPLAGSLFQIANPTGFGWDFDALVSYVKQSSGRIMLVHIHTGLELACTLVASGSSSSSSSSNQLLFMARPLVRRLDELSSFGLCLSDLSMLDSAVELLLLTDQQEAEITTLEAEIAVLHEELNRVRNRGGESRFNHLQTAPYGGDDNSGFHALIHSSGHNTQGSTEPLVSSLDALIKRFPAGLKDVCSRRDLEHMRKLLASKASNMHRHGLGGATHLSPGALDEFTGGNTEVNQGLIDMLFTQINTVAGTAIDEELQNLVNWQDMLHTTNNIPPPVRPMLTVLNEETSQQINDLKISSRDLPCMFSEELAVDRAQASGAQGCWGFPEDIQEDVPILHACDASDEGLQELSQASLPHASPFLCAEAQVQGWRPVRKPVASLNPQASKADSLANLPAGQQAIHTHSNVAGQGSSDREVSTHHLDVTDGQGSTDHLDPTDKKIAPHHQDSQESDTSTMHPMWTKALSKSKLSRKGYLVGKMKRAFQKIISSLDSAPPVLKSGTSDPTCQASSSPSKLQSKKKKGSAATLHVLRKSISGPLLSTSMVTLEKSVTTTNKARRLSSIPVDQTNSAMSTQSNIIDSRLFMSSNGCHGGEKNRSRRLSKTASVTSYFQSMKEAVKMLHPMGGASSFVSRISRDSYQEAQEVAILIKEPTDHVVAAMASIDHWQYNIFALRDATSGRPLSALAFYLFKRGDIIKRLALPEHKLARFLLRIEEGYPQNPYHCREHAADVLRLLHVIATRGGLVRQAAPVQLEADDVVSAMETLQRPINVTESALSPARNALNLMTIYFAAIIHDFEHKGVNNQFLCSTADPLALLYNDQSPMEHHHAAASFALLREERFNFLERLPRKVFNALRAQVIDMVLGTDMKQHFGLLSLFQSKVASTMTTHWACSASANGELSPELITRTKTNVGRTSVRMASSTSLNLTPVKLRANSAFNIMGTSTEDTFRRQTLDSEASFGSIPCDRPSTDLRSCHTNDSIKRMTRQRSSPTNNMQEIASQQSLLTTQEMLTSNPGGDWSCAQESEAPSLDAEQMMVLWKVALKCADLSNLANSKDVARKWVDLLEEEMFRQGDLERAAKLPISALMDRTKIGVSKSQPGFFNVVAIPLFSTFAQAFPQTSPLLDGAKNLLAMWVAEQNSSQPQ